MCLYAPATSERDVPESEPIIGYRYFRLNREGDDTTLGSLYQPVAWDEKPKTATCKVISTHAQDEAPQMDCSCGFYAYSSMYMLDELGADDRGNYSVPARVAMWGRVIDHVAEDGPIEGFRAQRQQVTALLTQKPRAYFMHEPGECESCDNARARAETENTERTERIRALADKLGVPVIEYADALAAENVNK